MLTDYNRLLAVGIWVFFFSGMLLLKRPGTGVAYLAPWQTRLRFPSWRAAFGSRLALVVYPVYSLWPIANVELFAPSRADSLRELQESAMQLSRSLRLARPLLVAVFVFVTVAIPLWIILRGADLVFLAMAMLAYALYVLSLVALISGGEISDQRRARAQWKTLLEPMLCLPYAPHLCRKLSACYELSVPLIDVLQSDIPLLPDDLRDLRDRLHEHGEITEEVDNLACLTALHAHIERRLAMFPQ